MCVNNWNNDRNFVCFTFWFLVLIQDMYPFLYTNQEFSLYKYASLIDLIPFVWWKKVGVNVKDTEYMW